MSYEDILEKIKAAKILAETKKKAHFEPPKVRDSKPQASPKDEVAWEEQVSQEHRASVQQWRKPRDLAPDGKTFLDLFTSRWKCYSKWPNNVKELDNLHNNFKDISDKFKKLNKKDILND